MQVSAPEPDGSLSLSLLHALGALRVISLVSDKCRFVEAERYPTVSQETLYTYS